MASSNKSSSTEHHDVVDNKWHTNCLIIPYIQSEADRKHVLNFFSFFYQDKLNCIRRKASMYYLTFDTVHDAVAAYYDAGVYLKDYSISFARKNTAIIIPEATKNRTIFVTNIAPDHEQDLIDVFKNDQKYTEYIRGYSWFRYYRHDGTPCKACCFITWSTPEMANEARKYVHDSYFYQRQLYCNFAITESRRF